MAEPPTETAAPKPFPVVAAVFVAALWLIPFAAAVPVAVYAARRESGRVTILIVLAAICEQLRGRLLGDWLPSAVYGDMITMAALGVLIGWALRRRWSYARTVVLATALMTPVFVVLFVLQWENLLAYAQETFEDRAGSEFAAENVYNLAFGWAALLMLLSACFGTSLTARWLEYRDRYRRNGSFRDLRQPDWLAWCAIGAFVLWYADQRWPHPALRMIGWNAALALFGIYWITGLAVIAYAVRALRLAPIWVFAGLFLILLSPAVGLPAAVGLMDTWGEFRRKLDRWAAARQGDDASID